MDYQLWYRNPRKVIHNIFRNHDLVDNIDYVPYREFEGGKHRYCDFMSTDWAWEQCVCCDSPTTTIHQPNPHKQDLISVDTDTYSAIFIPTIIGTDKTTTSVATGQHEYHPVYLSVGNVRNVARRAHKGALVLIGFLPIPKGECIYIFWQHDLTNDKLQVPERTPTMKHFATSVTGCSMAVWWQSTNPWNPSCVSGMLSGVLTTIFDVPFTASVHISQTIPSKQLRRVLCLTGVHRECYINLEGINSC